MPNRVDSGAPFRDAVKTGQDYNNNRQATEAQQRAVLNTSAQFAELPSPEKQDHSRFGRASEPPMEAPANGGTRSKEWKSRAPRLSKVESAGEKGFVGQSQHPSPVAAPARENTVAGTSSISLEH